MVVIVCDRTQCLRIIELYGYPAEVVEEARRWAEEGD